MSTPSFSQIIEGEAGEVKLHPDSLGSKHWSPHLLMSRILSILLNGIYLNCSNTEMKSIILMPELTLLFVKFVTALSVETKELIRPMDMN